MKDFQCTVMILENANDTEARGIFLYEDNNTYTDGDTVEGFSMYCNDFRKCEDGIWRISKMRIAYRKMNGKLHYFEIEQGWTPEEWEEWKAKSMIRTREKLLLSYFYLTY